MAKQRKITIPLGGPDEEVTFEDGAALPIDDFISCLRSGGRPSTGILPPAVRWISADQLGVIVERTPFYLNAIYDDTEYTLPVPWTITAIRFGADLSGIVDMRVFARNYPVLSLDDEMGILPFPNTYSDSRPCRGAHFDKAYAKAYAEARGSFTLASAINTAMALLWSGSFNNEVINWLNANRIPATLGKFATPSYNPGDYEAYADDLTGRVHRYLKHISKLDLATMTQHPFPVANAFRVEGDRVQDVIDQILRGNEKMTPISYIDQVYSVAKMKASLHSAK